MQPCRCGCVRIVAGRVASPVDGRQRRSGVLICRNPRARRRRGGKQGKGERRTSPVKPASILRLANATEPSCTTTRAATSSVTPRSWSRVTPQPPPRRACHGSWGCPRSPPSTRRSPSSGSASTSPSWSSRCTPAMPTASSHPGSGSWALGGVTAELCRFLLYGCDGPVLALSRSAERVCRSCAVSRAVIGASSTR